jgi:hypothetical protein
VPYFIELMSLARQSLPLHHDLFVGDALKMRTVPVGNLIWLVKVRESGDAAV